jgi:hypothetical protein
MASRTAEKDVEFSIDALIATVRDEVGPDPTDIAAKVQARIPKAHRDAVELKLLVNYVRMSKLRLAGAMAGSTRTTSATGRPARSAKVAGFQLLARALAVSVCVGRQQYKSLGDCTYQDLMLASENRRQHAAQTLAAAEEYEAWAALVKKHRADTVSSVPRQVLTDFVSGRSAAA